MKEAGGVEIREETSVQKARAVPKRGENGPGLRERLAEDTRAHRSTVTIIFVMGEPWLVPRTVPSASKGEWEWPSS